MCWDPSEPPVELLDEASDMFMTFGLVTSPHPNLGPDKDFVQSAPAVLSINEVLEAFQTNMYLQLDDAGRAFRYRDKILNKVKKVFLAGTGHCHFVNPLTIRAMALLYPESDISRAIELGRETFEVNPDTGGG